MVCVATIYPSLSGQFLFCGVFIVQNTFAGRKSNLRLLFPGPGLCAAGFPPAAGKDSGRIFPRCWCGFMFHFLT